MAKWAWTITSHHYAGRASFSYNTPTEHDPISAHEWDYTVTLIHAFISSRLDYFNSLRYGISGTLLRRLQSIQNAAARLVTGAKKFDHTSALVLRELHHGCRSASVSRTSCHSWCTSACTMLHQSSSAATVYRYHHLPWDNCVHLSVAPWTVSGQELFLVVARSECAALRRGTLYRQNCVLLLCVLTLSAKKPENLLVRQRLGPTESALDDFFDFILRYTNAPIYWLMKLCEAIYFV